MGQLAKLVAAYSLNATLGNAEEVLDVSDVALCGRMGTGLAITNS